MPDDPKNFTVTIDRTNQVAESIRKLSKLRVMVGIPDGGDKRQDVSQIGNAALGYIHEHGSPHANIPPRPFLVPGVAESKERWMPYLEQAGKAAFEGNQSILDRALNAAGDAAVSSVKARITAGIPPPLKPATVRARQRRGRGSSYRRQASAATDTTPLVDTGQLLNSVTYVVRKG